MTAPTSAFTINNLINAILTGRLFISLCMTVSRLVGMLVHKARFIKIIIDIKDIC